uniref:Uncharacterized protein n=1 Tax=Pseudonaja textilis TaxID=8673 RepID=A0A670YHE0_PSETE
MNAHNILLYEVKRRGNRLEELQRILQGLIDLEMASPELQLQLQTIRQLENNIEKMQVNIMTAEKVHILYVKMVGVLRGELSQLPFVLEDLEHRVATYQTELQGVDLMAKDMQEAMEAAKEDMANAESELIAEKKFRENSLSIQKKQIERIRAKDPIERHRRMQIQRDMDFPVLMMREGTRGKYADVPPATALLARHGRHSWTGLLFCSSRGEAGGFQGPDRVPGSGDQRGGESQKCRAVLPSLGYRWALHGPEEI